MANLWTNFWARSWRIKGPAIGALVLVVAIIIGAATGGGAGDDDGDEQASGGTTSEATATAEEFPPTDEPEPTAEPTAEPTVEPTAEPTAVPIPEPVFLEGVGQFATDSITLPAPVSIATFTHDGSRLFIVTVFQGTEQDLLVAKSGFYRGSRPLLGDGPVVLDIDADGPWTVTIEPIGMASSPAFSGAGDAVSGLFDPPSTGPWTVEHDGQRLFIVWLHCGSGSDLIQAESGPVSGSTVLSFGDGPCYWEVEADGGWALNPR